MLQLAICERYDARNHGKTEKSAENIEEHFLIESIELNDFYSGDYKHFRLGNGVEDPQYNVRLEIVEEHELEGGEAIGIVKTRALKRFQRKWRATYRQCD
jgi:hypothetical protein